MSTMDYPASGQELDLSDEFMKGLLSEIDMNVDASLWSDFNVDEGLGSPSESISLDECFSDITSSSNLNLTPPDTPYNSDRSNTPSSSTDLEACLSSPSSSNIDPFIDGISNPASNNITQFPAYLPPLAVQPVQAQYQPVLAPQFIPHHNAQSSLLLMPMNEVVAQASKNIVPREMSLKEARKIRNRQAACNSRMKQKEMFEKLKDQVAHLQKENVTLKQENSHLRMKLAFFEREAEKLKGVFRGSSKTSKKKAISVLAVVLVLGFNLAPFVGVFDSPGNKSFGLSKSSSSEGHHTGRALLWASDEQTANQVKNRISDEINDTLGFVGDENSRNSSSVQNQTQDPDCQTYINQTESIRLENDLRGWVLRVKRQKSIVKKREPALKANSRKASPVTEVRPFIASYQPRNNNLEQLSTQRNMEHVLQSIKRRSDTYYFVSFSADSNMILVPESNSTKVRPRFSILVPAMSVVNETSPGSGINSTYNVLSMMQIDCEVLNTKTVFVHNLISDSKIDFAIDTQRKLNGLSFDHPSLGTNQKRTGSKKQIKSRATKSNLKPSV